MVLIAHLIAPAAKATARINAFLLKFGEEGFKYAFALKGWRWIAVIETARVSGYDFVLGLKERSSDKPPDAVCQDGFLIDWFESGLGDFNHDRPIGAWLRGGGCTGA